MPDSRDPHEHATRKEAALSCGSFLRKGELFAYGGLIQKLTDDRRGWQHRLTGAAGWQHLRSQEGRQWRAMGGGRGEPAAAAAGSSPSVTSPGCTRTNHTPSASFTAERTRDAGLNPCRGGCSRRALTLVAWVSSLDTEPRCLLLAQKTPLMLRQKVSKLAYGTTFRREDRGVRMVSATGTTERWGGGVNPGLQLWDPAA